MNVETWIAVFFLPPLYPWPGHRCGGSGDFQLKTGLWFFGVSGWLWGLYAFASGFRQPFSISIAFFISSHTSRLARGFRKI